MPTLPPTTTSLPDELTPAGMHSNTYDLARTFQALFASEPMELVHPLTGAKAPALIIPRGRALTSVKSLLDEYLPKPERRRGTAQLTDVASFIAHIQRFRSDDSVVFANPSRLAPTLVSVYDYHPKGSEVTVAAWLEHRGQYAPALSDPWKAWSGKHNVQMSQADFAAFVEEHLQDIVVPNLDDPNLKTFADLVQGKFAEPSDMVALSRNLTINIDVVVKNSVTLSTGEISVTYDEQHKDGQGTPINVANLFQICVPVFYGGTLYRIAARLRYRQSRGTITWSYLLVRPDLVFDAAFSGIVKKVTDEAGVPVLLGAPEGSF